MTDCTIDHLQATKFLNILDPNAKTFCFQQIHDSIDKALPVTHLSINQLNQLNRKNRNGYGTFLSINPVEQGERRTANNVTSIRAIYADDDVQRSKPRTDWPVLPSVVIQSSKGKYHYYWILKVNGKDTTISHSEALKQHIASQYLTDGAGVKGPNRVLRLPGFLHNKKEPYVTNISALTERRYTISELDQAFGFSHVEQPLSSSTIRSTTGLLTSLHILKESNTGEYHVTCPWADQHTDESDDRANFLFAGTGGHIDDHFHCHHNSCSSRDINDVLALAADAAAQYLPEIKLSLFVNEIEIEASDQPGSMFRSWEDSLADEREPDWLVENLIERDTTNMVYGDTGAHKTFAVIDWGIRIATGTKLNDLYVEQGKVFYIASEGAGGINRRLRAHAKYYNLKAEGSFFASNVPAKLGKIDHMKQMATAIKDMCTDNGKPGLIIIDTLAASAGGLSTNDNDEMSELITLCNDMRRAIGGGVSFLLVHHTGHDKSRMRGASALKANVDSSIKLAYENDVVVLTVEKLKDGETNTEMYFTPHFVELGVHTKTRKPYGSLVLIDGDMSPGESLAIELGLSDGKARAFVMLFDMGATQSAVEVKDWRHLVQEEFVSSGRYKSDKIATSKANECVADIIERKKVKVRGKMVRISVT